MADTVRELALRAFAKDFPNLTSGADANDGKCQRSREDFTTGYLRSHRDTLDQVLVELRTLQGAFGTLSESHAALDDAIARIEKLKAGESECHCCAKHGHRCALHKPAGGT